VTSVRHPSPCGSDAGPALCAAATALLVTDGIAALDFDLVDREAGLPPGTCRNRYRSRPNLIAAMLEREAATYWAALDAIRAEYSDDTAGALVAWMTFLAGPDRPKNRAIWTLAFDPGVRRDAAMYLDALTVGWQREMVNRFRLTQRQTLVVLPMIEGWALHRVMFDAPIPDPKLLYEYVQVLLDRAA
jgi:AcrR family transcriptional regulator